MKFHGLKEHYVTGAAAVVVGLLLLLLKGKVISLILTIAGVLLLIWAFVDWRNKLTNYAIGKAVAGVCVLTFGWLFVNLALYIVAAVIIAVGLKQIVAIKNTSPVNLSMQEKVIIYAKPVLTVLAGIILFLNQGGVIDWVFIVVGIMLIVEGVLDMLDRR